MSALWIASSHRNRRYGGFSLAGREHHAFLRTFSFLNFILKAPVLAADPLF